MSSTTADTVSSTRFNSRARAAAIIRPTGPADMAALSDFFAGLSTQTRYLRFFVPITPTPAMLRVLSGGDASVDALVAVRGGVIIGHAMAADQPATEGSRRTGAVRDPLGSTVTDIGVVVADAWQGRGVGSALVRALVTRAQARGVTSITMEVLHANHRVLAMIERHWAAAETGRSQESVIIDIRLPRSEQLPTALPGPPDRCRPSRMHSRPGTYLVDARTPHQARRHLDNAAQNRLIGA